VTTEARVVPLARLFSALFADELSDRERRLAESSDGEGDGRHVWPRPPKESPEARGARQARQARERALVALVGNAPLGSINMYAPDLRVGWLDERPVLRFDGMTMVAENGHAVVYEDGRVTRYERGRFVAEEPGRIPRRLAALTLEQAPQAPTMGGRQSVRRAS